MNSTKLIQVLSHFNPRQFQYIQQALRVTFFNQRADISHLMDYIQSGLWEGSNDLDKHRAWEHVYPGLAYDDQKMRLLFSYALKAVERILSVMEFLKDDFEVRQHLTKAYQDVAFASMYQKTFRQLNQTLAKQPFRNTDFLQKQAGLAYQHYLDQSAKKRTNQDNLQHVEDTFDHYLIAHKLKLACLMAANALVFKKNYEVHFLEEILTHVDGREALLEMPAINIYYNAYRCMHDEDHAFFFEELRKGIDRFRSCFPHSEMRDIFIIALNYATRQMNRGHELFIDHSFALYKSGLENGLLLENGQISKFSFSNLVFIGLSLHEFDWVEQFISDYYELLPIKDRSNTYLLTSASLKYHQKAFGDALVLLNQFDPKDPLMAFKKA